MSVTSVVLTVALLARSGLLRAGAAGWDGTRGRRASVPTRCPRSTTCGHTGEVPTRVGPRPDGRGPSGGAVGQPSTSTMRPSISGATGEFSAR
ncbi:hypothetical protein FTX61_12560 [Nitriliruptoraceae bacterium ZYF776]|nr:hypothetical protein [Profundirhabdus halotolerans]